MKITSIAVLTAAAALAAPAAACAHVTVQPKQAAAGGFTRLDVRVPNERDNAGTTKVAVKMPPGIYSASYEPKPGWTVKVDRRKLTKPVPIEGEQQTDEVDAVTFTGHGDQGVIKPGQFMDFGLSVNVPDGKAGTTLTFPATQTYQGGEVVRWIGPAGADQPAPTLTLTAAAGRHGAAAAHGDQTSPSAAKQPAAAGSVSAADVNGKASKGLAIAALIVGALGLAAGAAGIAAARRRTTA